MDVAIGLVLTRPPGRATPVTVQGMFKRMLIPVMAGLALLLGSMLPSSATTDHTTTPQMPTHNESSLSLFSCAATRPSGFTSANVLHSHRVAASSTVDLFGQPEIDAFDCEVQNGGGGGPEAIYRTLYIYGNVDGGGDKGIVGPLNVIRFP